MRYKPAVCSLVLLLLSSGTHAADESYPNFVFNGYGTLGVVNSSEDKADFRDTLIQPNGAGFTRDWAFGVDSRIGLQVTADLNEKLSAVVQVVSEQRYDGSYTPTIEWANIKYDFTPDFSLRIGRVVLPVFITSDYRKVGYANPWVRPPVEVYGLLPISNSEGIDASYRFRTESFSNTLQVYSGRKDFDTEVSGRARDAFGVLDTAEFGDAIFHAGYHQATISAEETLAFFDLFRSFGAPGNAIADRYSIDDTPITLWTVGGSYDPGNWFVKSEFARSTSESFIGTLRGWYVTGGYRLRGFTPYAGIAQRTRLGNSSDPGLDIAALPPPLQGFALGLNAGLDTFLNANGYDTFTIGTRWDFADSIALKVQLDHMRLDTGSNAELINRQPGYMPGGTVNVFSATIDFVF